MSRSISLAAYFCAIMAAIPQQTTAPHGSGLKYINGFTVLEQDAQHPQVTNLTAELQQMMGMHAFWFGVQLNSTRHQHLLGLRLVSLFKSLTGLRGIELQTPWLKDFLHNPSVDLDLLAESSYVERFLSDYIEKDVEQLTLKLIHADMKLPARKLQFVRIQPVEGGNFIDIEIGQGEEVPRFERLPMFKACEAYGNHDGQYSLWLAAEYLAEKSELLRAQVLALAGVAQEGVPA